MMKYNIIQTDENNIETTKQYAKLTDFCKDIDNCIPIHIIRKQNKYCDGVLKHDSKPHLIYKEFYDKIKIYTIKKSIKI